MNSLYKDIQYSLHQIYRNAGFSSVVIAILALGIGLAAATFTVVYALFLSPLPYPAAEKLVAIGQANRADSHPGTSALPNIRDWKTSNSSLQEMAYWNLVFRNLEDGNVAESVAVVESSANLFQTLGVQPSHGRGFSPDEDQPGKGQVAVLSAAVWRRLFHSNPNALNRSVKIGNEFYNVIGVMNDEVTFPLTNGNSVVWIPIQSHKDLEDRNIAKLEVIGRLKEGSTVSQAREELNTIQGRVAGKNPSDKVLVEDYRELLVGNLRLALFALEAAVLAVWLIACLNVLSLVLARTANRRHEIAIRCAIGATRNRLLGLQLMENAVLCAAGAFLGVLFSAAVISVLRFYLEAHLPFADHMRLNLPVIGVVAVLSIISTLILGIIPTLQVYKTSPQESLKEGTAAAGISRHQRFIHNSLVIGEVALSYVLLISGGLLVHTLYSLRNVPLGFQPEKLLVSPLVVPQHLYAGKDIVQLVYEPALSRVQQLPGVELAAISTVLPMNANSNTTIPVQIFGKPVQKNTPHNAQLRLVSPGFYQTLGIRVLEGRLFTEADNSAAPWVVVVNQAFVRKYFPNEEALGKRVRTNDEGPNKYSTIVGVTENIQQKSLAVAVEPEVDLCYMQVKPEDDFSILLGLFSQIAVRTKPSASASALAPELLKALRESNPDLAGANVTTMSEVINKSVESQTMAARLLGIFSISALLIAVFGLYGLLAYKITKSKQDIGLRIALGATPKTILCMVLRQALVLVIGGILLGMILASQVGHLLRSFLYGVGPNDLFTICLVIAVLMLCSLVASYFPARRASRIDPIRSLRFE